MKKLLLLPLLISQNIFSMFLIRKNPNQLFRVKNGTLNKKNISKRHIRQLHYYNKGAEYHDPKLEAILKVNSNLLLECYFDDGLSNEKTKKLMKCQTKLINEYNSDEKKTKYITMHISTSKSSGWANMFPEIKLYPKN